MEHKKLAPDVSIAELAEHSKNFSGAEIEGLVRAATSTAMNRLVKVIISKGGSGWWKVTSTYCRYWPVFTKHF